MFCLCSYIWSLVLKTEDGACNSPTPPLKNPDSSAEVFRLKIVSFSYSCCLHRQLKCLSVAQSPGLSALAMTWDRCLNNFISFLLAHTIFFALLTYMNRNTVLPCLVTCNSQPGDSGECNLPFCGSSELGLTWNVLLHHSCSVGPCAKLLQLKKSFFSPSKFSFLLRFSTRDLL